MHLRAVAGVVVVMVDMGEEEEREEEVVVAGVAEGEAATIEAEGEEGVVKTMAIPCIPPLRANDECLACGAKDHRVRSCPFLKAAVDAAKDEAPENKGGGSGGGKDGGKDGKDKKDRKDPPPRLRNSAQRLLRQHQTLASPSTVVAWDSCSSVCSLPKHLVPGLDEVGYLTSDEVLELPERPDSLIVVGGHVFMFHSRKIPV
jgi:hypothetical protein